MAHPPQPQVGTPKIPFDEKLYNQIMIADALALVDYLQKNKTRLETLSALFDPQGVRLEGSDKLEIEVIPSDGGRSWFYRVKPIKDYVFVPVPVQPCHIDYRSVSGQTNPSSDIFRFTASMLMNFSGTSNVNLSVKFSIVGYKPKQLLSKIEK